MQFPPDINGKISGIYIITCLVNGRIYVGSAKKFGVRFNTHNRTLLNRTHHNSLLQRAWDKYGPDAFEWKVLETVSDLADLACREQHYLDLLEACGPKGYNLYPTARSALGSRHSVQTKARMAVSARRRKPSPARTAHLMSLAQERIGVRVSIDTLAKRAATVAAQKAVGVQAEPPSPEEAARLAARRAKDAVREASWTPEQAVYRAAQRHAVYETHKEGRRVARLADIENRRVHENELDRVRRAARTLQQIEQDNAKQRAARAANVEVHRAKDRARQPGKAVLEAQVSPDEATVILDARNAQARAAYAARRAANIEASRAKNRAAYAAKKVAKAAKAADEAAKSEEAQSLKLAAD